MKQVEKLKYNASAIQAEIMWLASIIDTRLKLYFQQECDYQSIQEVPVPDLSDHPSMYAAIVRQFDMDEAERLILILTLTPHITPQLLDVFFTQNQKYNRGFTEFGGVKGIQHGGFMPTGETAAFLLAINDISSRLLLSNLFRDNHFFRKNNILSLESPKAGEPLLAGLLQISNEYLSLLTLGIQYQPRYSSTFPASKLETLLEWEDLVLEYQIMNKVKEIESWIRHEHKILYEWKLIGQIKPGFRCLFHGPPGTGKTLTASLLGKSTGLDVYRVDLSKVVSKYIGETEKNLANIFDQAENKNWILFFDEADALFGKRTNTNDAKDRYANQEVAYLLQRIEDFPRVVILATNLKSNLDTAFARRFQSIIHFPVPKYEQRLLLWQKAFSTPHLELADDVDFQLISKRYKMAGGAIINVLRYCALQYVNKSSTKVYLEDIIEGIDRELRKEGKNK